MQKGGNKKSRIRSPAVARPRFQLPLQPTPPGSPANLELTALVVIGGFHLPAQQMPISVRFLWEVRALCLGEGEVVCTRQQGTGGQPFQAGERLKGRTQLATGEICHSLTKYMVSGRKAVGQLSSCIQVGERLGIWW